MDEFKEQISEDVLNTLTMEDLWKNPGIKKLAIYSNLVKNITARKRGSASI